MAPVAGYSASVSVTGTTTAITGEATTDVAGGHTIFQITDTTRRVLDPNVTVIVKKDGAAQSAALFTVNYLFGKITFLSAIGAGHTVTVDCNYLPLLTVATAKAVQVSTKRASLDATRFADGPDTARIYGLLDAEGSITALEDLLTDHDPGGGTRKFRDVLMNATARILLDTYLSTSDRFRAFVAFDEQSLNLPVAGIVEASIKWKLAGDGAGKASFSRGS